MPFNPIPSFFGNSLTQPNITATTDQEIVTRMIAEAVAAEREECAKVCEANHGTVNRNMDSFDCAKAIRARGEA